MKLKLNTKIRHGFLLTAILFTSLTVTPSVMAAASWQAIGAANFVNNASAGSLQLALDGSTPCIAYADSTTGQISVQKFDGSNWVNVGTPDFTPGSAGWPDFVVHNGTPYLAYMDGTNNLKATVQKFDGSNWVNVGTPGFSIGRGYYPTLVFNNNTAYVAYYDVGDSVTHISEFDGTNWVSAFPSANVYPANLSFTFDGSTPYLGYSDSSANWAMSVQKYDGSNWVNVGTPGFSGSNLISNPSISVNNGTPYVAYSDSGANNAANVQKFDGSNWVNVGTPGFIPEADVLSFAINNGTPYAAYWNSNTNTIGLEEYINNNWVDVGGSNLPAGSVSDEALVFNNNVPYLAFTSGTNINEATLMAYYDPASNTSSTHTTNGVSSSPSAPDTGFGTPLNSNTVLLYLIFGSGTLIASGMLLLYIKRLSIIWQR